MSIRRLLSSSRYLTIIAVLCTLLAATALMIYGAFATVQVVVEVVAYGKISMKVAKEMVLSFIELVDVFLLGTVLYIISVGLYELFIAQLDLPEWLVISDLDMLKDKLVAVIVVVLGVVFLGQVMAWDGQSDLLNYGVAIALVIAALTFFLSQKPQKPKKPKDKEQE